jgi:hypothetical protein
MSASIAAAGCQYFRVHDSGDMFSQTYAQPWLQVCQQLPMVKFWIPTRAWQQPSAPLPVFDPLIGVLRQLAELPNVTVRPSALNFGDSAPVVAGLQSGSTADGPGAQCPSASQGGKCLECRACWDSPAVAISYRKH